MGNVQQLISAIGVVERELESQLQVIDGFSAKIEKLIQNIDNVLAGSLKGYDRKLVGELQQTNTELERTKNELQKAKQALAIVSLI